MRTTAVDDVRTVCTVETMARTMTILYSITIVAMCLIECRKGQSRKKAPALHICSRNLLPIWQMHNVHANGFEEILQPDVLDAIMMFIHFLSR